MSKLANIDYNYIEKAASVIAQHIAQIANQWHNREGDSYKYYI